MYPTDIIPWFMDYQSKMSLSKWNKIYLNCAFYLANHLSVHTIWQIWIQDPRHNLYHWAIPYIKDIVDGCLISVPIWHNLSRSLHFSGTWTFFKILWSVISVFSFIAFASLSWPYWSFAPSFFKEFYIWNRLVYYASGVS